MHKVIQYDDDIPMMILDTDGGHISLYQVGAVLRALKFSPAGAVFLWTGKRRFYEPDDYHQEWTQLPRFITFIEGDQR